MAFNDDHEYVTIPLEGFVSPEEHIKNVRNAAKGLVQVHIECAVENDYGGDRAVMYLIGHRILTAEEKQAKRAKRRELEAETEQREREQYAKLKEKYEGGK